LCRYSEDGDGSVDYTEFSRMLGEETYRMTHSEKAKMTYGHSRHGDDARKSELERERQRNAPPPPQAHGGHNSRRSVAFNESLNEEHSAAPLQGPRKSFIRRPSMEANEHENRAYTVRLQQVLDMLRKKITSQKSLRECFRTFDQDKDGFIDLDEFKKVIHSLHLDLDDDDCMAIIKFCDKDFNGVLDYQEFCDKFAAQWSAGGEKEVGGHKAVTPRTSISLPEGGTKGGGGGGVGGYGGMATATATGVGTATRRPQMRVGDKTLMFQPGLATLHGDGEAAMAKMNASAAAAAAAAGAEMRAAACTPGGGGDMRDGGTAHVHANAEKYSRERRLSFTAAKHIQSQALGPGPRLADALCHGLHPVSFAPLLQQFRLADAGRSGFIPLPEFQRVISEQLRMMNISTRLAHDRYADLDADMDKHGYVDYITFYDRVAIASTAGIGDGVAVKPAFVRNAGSIHSSELNRSGGDVVNMDTLAGFRKPAYGRTPTVGAIPYKMATRGVSRNVLADRQFSRGGIAGYLSKGEGMETPGMDRLGGGRFDHLSGGRSGPLSPSGSGVIGGNGGNEGSMFSGGTSSSAVGKYAAPSLRHGGGGGSAIGGGGTAIGREIIGFGSGGSGTGNGTGRGVLQAALARPGRHTHTKFPNTDHMTSAPAHSPAYGNDDQRYYGHAGSGLVEDPHTGLSPKFPPGPTRQYTSRYEAKLERMRSNEVGLYKLTSVYP
jgi:hypothetical protein